MVPKGRVVCIVALKLILSVCPTISMTENNADQIHGKAMPSTHMIPEVNETMLHYHDRMALAHLQNIAAP